MEGVRVVRNPRARRLALRADVVRRDVCLVIPRRVSDKRAWEFAREHAAWISARIEKMGRPVPFVDGAVVPVFGQGRRITIIPCGGRVTSCILHDDVLEVRTPRADPAANIRRFLYATLEEAARPLLEEKAARIGKKMTVLQLRDTSTRWGRCSPDGSIMLCWRLVFAPPYVLDYVVGHEVAHLRHLDHSPAFWTLCASLSDRMGDAQDWLRRHGNDLLKYGAPS